MNVRFSGSNDVYTLKVEVHGKNTVRLYPPKDGFSNVDLASGFELLTREKGGKVFGNYLDYTTVYGKLEDGSVILSNDGSVYVPPEEIEQIPDEEQYIPTLEQVKEWKKQEVGRACEKTIFAGVDVKIGDNYEHFSLETNDQINLFGKQYQLASGATAVEYHQDGCPCKYYSAEDMMKIITAAMEWVSYHTTYCNALNMWIAGVKTKEEVNAIFYGADIPEEYQSEVLKDYLTKIAAEAEAAVNEANS